jgi:hypothetical protein
MKNVLLPILLLASLFSSAAFAEQKTGQQTSPPPQSQSDNTRKPIQCETVTVCDERGNNCHPEGRCN